MCLRLLLSWVSWMSFFVGVGVQPCSLRRCRLKATRSVGDVTRLVSLKGLEKSFKNAGAPILCDALLESLRATGKLKRYKYKAYADRQRRRFKGAFYNAIDKTETWVGIDLNRLKLLPISEETIKDFEHLLGDSS